MEATAQLVVDAAMCHPLQGRFDDLQLWPCGLCADLAAHTMQVHAQEKFQGHRIGKLGRVAKTAVRRVKVGGQFLAGIRKHLQRHSACRGNITLAAQRGTTALL